MHEMVRLAGFRYREVVRRLKTLGIDIDRRSLCILSGTSMNAVPVLGAPPLIGELGIDHDAREGFVAARHAFL